MNRYFAICALIVVATAAAAGCSSHNAQRYPALAASALKVYPESGPNTLSREHSAEIEVPEADLPASFRRVADRCAADSAHHCVILQSDLSSGQFASGLVKLRIDPSGVEDLLSFASSLGGLQRRSTKAEDLADAIADTHSRIEMLTAYRKQLLDLQAKAAANVDAAIKIAGELSTVQTALEKASGEAAYQVKRTTTEIVSIDFVVSAHRAFWRPVGDAAGDFLQNLASGIAQAITAVAYIVPWLFVIVPGLYLLRFLWRRRGRNGDPPPWR
jgi:Domain of unknown function (DUF4349)